MRKGTILLLLLSLCAMFSQATNNWFSQLKGKWDTTRTVQYEAAQYQITYEFKYAKDAKYPNVKRTATTILRVGNQYNLFTDYGLLAFDCHFCIYCKGGNNSYCLWTKADHSIKRHGIEGTYPTKQKAKDWNNTTQGRWYSEGISTKNRYQNLSGNWWKETVSLLDIPVRRQRHISSDVII